VRAFKGTLNSGYSNIATATTAAPPPPAAPGNLTAAPVSSSQIILSWSDSSGDEDGFAIERSTDGSNFTPLSTVGANVTSYNSTGLNASTTYWYRVRAFRGTSNSAYSATASATTSAPPPPPPPAAPGNLTATPISSSQINLAWSDNSGDEDGFAIERSTDGSSFSPLATVGANVTSYSSTGLNAATTYWYRVRTSRGTSVSAYTPSAGATTAPKPPPPPAATPPAAPSLLTATPLSTSQISLSWRDNAADESGFVIERSTGGAFSTVATVGANVTSFTDGVTTPLAPATSYTYRVRAQNGAGLSGASNTVNATTTAAGSRYRPSGTGR
jgi:phosphodiesterase/alkaline phosphatase D-like protein